MKKRTQEEKKEFVKTHYIKCPRCEYNNEKKRFMQYGTCLKCGEILDHKTYFMIEMMKKIRDNKRKRS